MSNSYRIVFMGTPSFAAKPLKLLCERGYKPVAVYTQPDKINGRGKKITFSPVKILSMENEIPVYQPVTFKDPAVVNELKSLKPDVIIVVAYGKILPQSVLDSAKYGAINIHASLLPEYRGAAPIQRVIIDGKDKSGITIMQLDSGMDTGKIITSSSFVIPLHMTAGELFDSLSEVGAKELIRVLEDLPEYIEHAVPQDHDRATYAEKITKEMGRINWNKSAKSIDALIRGMYPDPGTYTYFRGKRIKIHRAFFEPFNTDNIEPGSICSLKNGYIGVAAKGGIVYLVTVQPENHKQMKALDFINGYQVKENDYFEA